MTANQIAYWQLVETRRANAAREVETNRANVAKESEQHRANVASETETSRAHKATEAENLRSHLATESLTTRDLIERNRHNLVTEAESERSNRAREEETLRSNLAGEALKQQSNLLQKQSIVETATHNRELEALQGQANLIASTKAESEKQHWERSDDEMHRANVERETQLLNSAAETASQNAAQRKQWGIENDLEQQKIDETKRNNTWKNVNQSVDIVLDTLGDVLQTVLPNKKGKKGAIYVK